MEISQEELNHIINKKIEDRSKKSSYRAERASDLCYKLAIAGFAVTWLFMPPNRSNSLIIFSILLVFSLSIVAQLLHEIYGAILLKRYASEKAIQKTDDGLSVPSKLPNNRVNFLWCLWLIKFIFVCIGYIMIALLYLIEFMI